MNSYSEDYLIYKISCAKESLEKAFRTSFNISRKGSFNCDTICGTLPAGSINSDRDFYLQKIDDLLSLTSRLGGRLLYSLPSGHIFILSSVVFEKKPVALLYSDAIFKSGKENNKKAMISPSDLSSKDFIMLYHISFVVNSFIESFTENQKDDTFCDYFYELSKSLLKEITKKDPVAFNEKISQSVYDLIYCICKNIYCVRSVGLMIFVMLLDMAEKTFGDASKFFISVKNLYVKISTAKYENEVESSIKKLCEEFSKAVFGKITTRSMFISDAILYINKNLDKKLSLEQVASEIYVSPNYLSKAFIKETGVNFSSFLSEARVEKAKALLQNESLSLTDIAKLVGFNTQSYFSKVFKVLTGKSPNEYRKRKH